jgi:hypothetical protein
MNARDFILSAASCGLTDSDICAELEIDPEALHDYYILNPGVLAEAGKARSSFAEELIAAYEAGAPIYLSDWKAVKGLAPSDQIRVRAAVAAQQVPA